MRADAVGVQLELAGLGLAVPDLDEAGGVGEQQLHLALGPAAQEAGLQRGVADLLALGVDDPGAREVVEERAAVVGEDELLAELERLDRRVVAVAVAAPAAQQPGHRAAVGVQVVGELERHGPSRLVGHGSPLGRQGHLRRRRPRARPTRASPSPRPR